MISKTIQWPALVAMGILLALARLVSELAGIWPWDQVRPDLLFCLADLAGSFAAPGHAIFSYASCGLLGDLFVGPRPGAGMAAYTASGLVLISWRRAAAPGGWLENLILVGIASCLMTWIRMALEAKMPGVGWLAWEALAGGLATVAAYPLLALVLCLPAFCPWRETGPLRLIDA